MINSLSLSLTHRFLNLLPLSVLSSLGLRPVLKKMSFKASMTLPGSLFFRGLTQAYLEDTLMAMSKYFILSLSSESAETSAESTSQRKSKHWEMTLFVLKYISVDVEDCRHQCLAAIV